MCVIDRPEDAIGRLEWRPEEGDAIKKSRVEASGVTMKPALSSRSIVVEAASYDDRLIV